MGGKVRGAHLPVCNLRLSRPSARLAYRSVRMYGLFALTILRSGSVLKAG
jgi:hypothetical protein